MTVQYTRSPKGLAHRVRVEPDGTRNILCGRAFNLGDDWPAITENEFERDEVCWICFPHIRKPERKRGT